MDAKTALDELIKMVPLEKSINSIHNARVRKLEAIIKEGLAGKTSRKTRHEEKN